MEILKWKDCTSDYRHEVIKALKEGKTIQYFCYKNYWEDCHPHFAPAARYRIKPEEKEITPEDLVVGETVLLNKASNKHLLLGKAGLVYFVSDVNDFEYIRDKFYTIKELNEHFTLL